MLLERDSLAELEDPPAPLEEAQLVVLRKVRMPGEPCMKPSDFQGSIADSMGGLPLLDTPAPPLWEASLAGHLCPCPACSYNTQWMGLNGELYVIAQGADNSGYVFQNLE